MKTTALVVMFGAAALQAQEHSLKARELFYAPPPSAQTQPKGIAPAKPKTPGVPTPKIDTPKVDTPKVDSPRRPDVSANSSNPQLPLMNVSLSPLALRYSVLKRNAQGAFEETDGESTFRSGDRIRLSVQANDTGYLYVVMRGSSGAWRVLFPAPDEAGGDNKVVKGKNYTVPAGKNGQFFFDETGGEEKLFLILTRRAEPDLESLVYAMADKDKKPAGKQMLLAENRPPINDQTVDRLRSELKSRDLVFEKVDEERGEKKEKAVYVANPSSTGDSKLVVDVLLRHK